VNREAVEGARGQGGPTGLFTVYNGATFSSQPSTLYRTRSAGAVTKSGTNDSKAKLRRGSGAGGGIGSGTGIGSGGSAGGALPSPNAPPPRALSAAIIDADGAEFEKLLSPAEKKRAALEARLHPSLLAVVDRLKNKTATVGTDEPKFIRDGKAEVQVWLTDKSAESLAALKGLGFEVILDPKSAKLVIGRLPIEKLEALAELKFVRYVSPQISSR
jgi:hypothetical protein